MNTSVTKALREVLLELFAYTPKREVYSDVRKGGEAIGVKFVGLKLTDDELDQVRHQMEARGFTHHYSRMNAQGNWTTGTRFCYSPPGVEIVKKPKQNKKTEQSAVSLGIENKAMNKEKIKPVSMKCSREQFEEVKPILVQHGLRLIDVDYNVSEYNYLINNLGGNLGRVTNYSRSNGNDRVIVDKWDLDLFLWYCGIETNKNMSTPKMYEVHLRDIMKIHDIACDTWKEIIMNDYISKVHNLKLTYTFFQSDVDMMFKAATSSQVPVLEQVFGKQVEKIEWDKIKTGSKVKIKYSGEHCSGWRWDMQETREVDVVFFGTEHYIRENGTFGKQSLYNHYFTFHTHDDRTNKFVLFGSNHFDDCKNFIVEVVEY